ncbi:hypothetical protein V5799_022800 [Amblyomma americanum]|uniref:Monocarboxylate transporter n=1 Tax=Amblyomma americanum TaxID=6943 RepID=A0AAQ4FJC7_AMBAM
MVHHFEKYRATALALVSGSVDVSGMMTPSLVQLFIDKYSFSGCLLLLGGLSLNLFIACIFLKRPGKHETTDEAAADEQHRTDDDAVKAPEITTTVEASAPKEPRSGRGDHVPGDGTDSTVAAAWQHSRGDVRTWLRHTVSLAMVHVRPTPNSHGGDSARDTDEPPKAALSDKDGVSKQVSSLKLYVKSDETTEGSSSIERNRLKLEKKRRQNLEEARRIQELVDVIEVLPDPDVEDEDNKSPPQNIGFMHKLREVSTAYIWMVCLSKGAANFCSYTFGLVIVDYAHGNGVLGQKAALLPALFSLGCLTATLLTGPAVDRSWVSK